MRQLPEAITAVNKSPLIQILTCIFFSIAILSLLVRLGTKFARVGRLSLDDHLASVSTLFLVCQSIAVVSESRNGLGKHSDALSSRQMSIQMKSEYAANILYIIAVAAAKLSYLSSISSLTVARYKKLAFGGAIFIIIWSVSALFVVFFSGQLPEPWNYRGKCINRAAFWTSYSIVNIITEILSIIFLIVVTTKIQTTLKRKIFVIFVFGNRILIIPVLIGQLIFRNRRFHSDDETWHGWKAAVATQVSLCMAVLTICVPYLKPFLDSLDSGQMRVDGTRHVQSRLISARQSHHIRREEQHSVQRSSRTKDMLQSAASQNSAGSVQVSEASYDSTRGYVASVVASPMSSPDLDEGEGGVIQQTRTWQITEESMID